MAQQIVEDRVRLRGMMTDLEREWATWMPPDADSPGRIVAACVLIYGLIPEANQAVIVHASLPQAPNVGRQPSPAPGTYGRRIGR